MSRLPDLQERQRLLPVLWQHFIDKVDREWNNKYSHLGPHRNHVSKPKQLAKAILTDILSSAQEIGFQEFVTITPATLHKYLVNNGCPPAVKPPTIIMLLRYCGFKDWTDFRQAEPNERYLPDPQSDQWSEGNTTNDWWGWLAP